MSLCECGCGELAPLSRDTDRRFGWVKGEPRRFILGHNFRTPEARAKSAERARVLAQSRTGEKNHMWRGEDADYSSKHQWMNRNYMRSGICEECGAEGRTNWANLDHKYRRVREDWKELCLLCHRRLDGWREKVAIAVGKG